MVSYLGNFPLSNFIIYALPRSRTAWCSKFLTYQDHTCAHEIALEFRIPEDYKNYFSNPLCGAAETGVAQGWWLIEHACPSIKTVVIHRDLEEVVQSILETDFSGVATYDRDKLTKHMSYSKRMLDDISKRPDVLNLNFKDLVKMEECQKLFEFCLPYKFDVKWWGSLKNQNIQINFKEMLRYYFKHKEEISLFKKLCKQELIKLRRTDKNNPIWKDR